VTFSALIFDWRGTLVTTLSWRQWAEEGLRRAGRECSPARVEELVWALDASDPGGVRLDGPGVDCDAEVHRKTYFEVFGEAGFAADVAQALYAVESDYRFNLFAADVAPTLRRLKESGARVAVLSDIHFDIRPAFAAAGMGGLIDAFVLSFEQGVQKPDPAVFGAALSALAAVTDEALMVGDRSGPDGAAVEHGITTLLLPPLRSPDDRRLDRVLALTGNR
jgi:FMN phosphatase YigB (HAD superfamily)